MAGGRPTILNQELTNELVKYIRTGNYIETACAIVGVAKQSVYNWMKQGRRGESLETAEFLDAIEKALAESEARDVVLIGKAAEKNWCAAAWRLERKNPERWGRKDRLDLNHGGGMSILNHNITDDELDFFKKNFKTFFPDLESQMDQEPESEADND